MTTVNKQELPEKILNHVLSLIDLLTNADSDTLKEVYERLLIEFFNKCEGVPIPVAEHAARSIIDSVEEYVEKLTSQYSLNLKSGKVVSMHYVGRIVSLLLEFVSRRIFAYTMDDVKDTVLHVMAWTDAAVAMVYTVQSFLDLFIGKLLHAYTVTEKLIEEGKAEVDGFHVSLAKLGLAQILKRVAIAYKYLSFAKNELIALINELTKGRESIYRLAADEMMKK